MTGRASNVHATPNGHGRIKQIEQNARVGPKRVIVSNQCVSSQRMEVFAACRWGFWAKPWPWGAAFREKSQMCLTPAGRFTTIPGSLGGSRTFACLKEGVSCITGLEGLDRRVSRS